MGVNAADHGERATKREPECEFDCRLIVRAWRRSAAIAVAAEQPEGK
jgi:hypothetical protein